MAEVFGTLNLELRVAPVAHVLLVSLRALAAPLHPVHVLLGDAANATRAGPERCGLDRP